MVVTTGLEYSRVNAVDVSGVTTGHHARLIRDCGREVIGSVTRIPDEFAPYMHVQPESEYGTAPRPPHIVSAREIGNTVLLTEVFVPQGSLFESEAPIADSQLPLFN